MRKVRIAKLGILLGLGLLAAAPVGAGHELSKSSALVDSPATAQATDRDPGSMDWLLILGAFGILGAISRRATPHPLQDPLYT